MVRIFSFAVLGLLFITLTPVQVEADDRHPNAGDPIATSAPISILRPYELRNLAAGNRKEGELDLLIAERAQTPTLPYPSVGSAVPAVRLAPVAVDKPLITISVDADLGGK